MKRFSRTWHVMLLAVFVLFSVMREPASGYEVNPNVLYQRAWRLIRENFYDQKFNGQDWNVWKSRFDGKLYTKEDAYVAIETMLASLKDPSTRFLPQSEFDEDELQFGVGLLLKHDTKKNVVVGVVPQSPASNAGVKGGWTIRSVDGKSVDDLSLADVVKLVRGPDGSTVKIEFLNNKSVIVKSMNRADYKSPAIAFAGRISREVGYIRLEYLLSRELNEQMREKLGELKDTKAMILDLRDNNGGFLTYSVDLANMFLKRGIICNTVDADGYKNTTFSMNRPLYTNPVVVLVNGGTAGAAEMLAAALSESGGAIVVGEHTRGATNIHAINRLDDGSGIDITIAKALTPSGLDLTGVGLIPTRLVELKQTDHDAGNGQWWLGKESDGTFPQNIRDIQVLAAIQILKEKMIVGK